MSRIPLGRGMALMREALAPPHIPERPSLPPLEPVTEYERELERERAEKAAWRAVALCLVIAFIVLLGF